MKVNAVKYVFVHGQVVRQFDIDARFFIKAILKDALNGEIKVIRTQDEFGPVEHKWNTRNRNRSI